MTSLKEGIKFHGHLGPYLVLGILAGELALKKLRAKKYFGLDVRVLGADKKPKSCFIDGLQLATGATYGKGNIIKLKAAKVRVIFRNLQNHRKLKLWLKRDLSKKLNSLKGHHDSEAFARTLYKTNPRDLFNIT